MQKWIQPPACSGHGLHRILFSSWLAYFQLIKKSAKVQLYFGLDCGTMEFFTSEPQPKEPLISLPHFWSTVRRKRSRFEHMQTVNRTSREIRGLFASIGSELWSLLKNSKSKFKNGKHIAVDDSRPIQWFHSLADPIWPNGTFNGSEKLMICRKYPVPKTEKERKEALETSTKFLVVRHPLDRLVSSYLDKVRALVR